MGKIIIRRFIIEGAGEGYTNFRLQIGRVTKCCTLSPNVCGFSLRNWPRVDLQSL